MALVGSVITKDMEYNTIYAGSPAKSISDKAGFQFAQVPLEHKLEMMQEYVLSSGIDSSNIKIVSEDSFINFNDMISYFNVSSRKYTKKRTAGGNSIHEIFPSRKSEIYPIPGMTIPFNKPYLTGKETQNISER